MARMTGKTRPVHALDKVMPVQELRHPGSVPAVAFHAEPEGFEAAQEQVAFETAGGASVMPEARHAHGAHVFTAAGGDARHEVAVTTQVLRGGVHGDVDAVLSGPGEPRRAEGAVGDRHGPVLPAQPADLFEV